jgi:hypothetical protein
MIVDYATDMAKLAPAILVLLDERLPEFPVELRKRLAELLAEQILMLHVTALGQDGAAVEASRLFMRFTRLLEV